MGRQCLEAANVVGRLVTVTGRAVDSRGETTGVAQRVGRYAPTTQRRAALYYRPMKQVLTCQTRTSQKRYETLLKLSTIYRFKLRQQKNNRTDYRTTCNYCFVTGTISVKIRKLLLTFCYRCRCSCRCLFILSRSALASYHLLCCFNLFVRSFSTFIVNYIHYKVQQLKYKLRLTSWYSSACKWIMVEGNFNLTYIANKCVLPRVHDNEFHQRRSTACGLHRLMKAAASQVKAMWTTVAAFNADRIQRKLVQQQQPQLDLCSLRSAC